MYNRNFYKVFNIPEDATNEQIDKAYRELVFIYHSDKTGMNDIDLKFINHIRNVLKDPKKRAAHDEYIRNIEKNSSSEKNQTTYKKNEPVKVEKETNEEPDGCAISFLFIIGLLNEIVGLILILVSISTGWDVGIIIGIACIIIGIPFVFAALKSRK